MTRQELAAAGEVASYHIYLPSDLPSGVTYARMDFNRKHPEYGVGILFLGPDPSIQTLQLDEQPISPVMSANPRNPLNQLSARLQGRDLANGHWLFAQQQGQPLRGAWLYFATLNGVQVNAQSQIGDRAEVEAIVASLR